MANYSILRLLSRLLDADTLCGDVYVNFSNIKSNGIDVTEEEKRHIFLDNVFDVRN